MKELKEEGLAKFEKFVTDNLNGSDYLSGTKDPMYIDIHAYPILERMVLLEGSPWDYAAKELDIKTNCPNLYAYVHRMRSHPVLKVGSTTPAVFNSWK